MKRMKTFLVLLFAAAAFFVMAVNAAAYNITINAAENGTVTADKTTANQDETVTLTVTPDAGYELNSLKYRTATALLDAVESDDTHYYFSMPGADVTVIASFWAEGSGSGSGGGDDPGSGPGGVVDPIESSTWDEVKSKFASGANVRLTADVTCPNSVTVEALSVNGSGESFTLDLNGHTLDCGSGSIGVGGHINLTITDSGENGKICGAGKKLIDIKQNSVLILAGGSIENTGGNSAVYVYHGTFTMTGGSIKSTGESSSVLVNGGTFTMAGGSISAKGYGVELNESNFTMTDGMIADCSAAVDFVRTCNFTMTGGTITRCGRGVSVSDESSVFLSGSPVISGNDSLVGLRDLVLPPEKTVTVDGPLTEGADIGVRIDGGSGTGVFAVGTGTYSITGDDLAHFRSDDPNNYAVELNGNREAVLSKILGTRLEGHTISLDGDIGVNFYIELDSAVAASQTAYMEFTVPNGETQTVYVKDADQKTVDGKKCHVFKCTVAAKEMTDNIKAQIVDGEARGTEYTYSVKEYADYLLAHTGDNTAYANAAPLVRAMLNYGAQSQIYFGYNTGVLANADLSDAEKTLGAIGNDVPADYTENNLPAGVTFEGATLTLRSETSLSLYFKDANEGNGTLTFAPSGFPAGVTLEPEQNLIDGCRVVRIRGIQAKYLGDSFTVSVTKGGHTGSVTHSPMTYCKKAEAGSDTNLANVAKALYAYWKEAKTYFNYTGNSGS